MAVVETMSVRRSVLPVAPNQARTKAVAMVMKSENGKTVLNIPYAPRDVRHANLMSNWTTVPRPFLLDNVYYSGPMRPTMSFDLEVHDKQVPGSTSVTRAISVLQALQSLAKSGRVWISYGAMESGLWWVTKLEVQTTRRDPLTDEVTSASVSLDLLRAESASTAATGPTTGGAVAAVAAATKTTTTTTMTKTASTPAKRTHTVKSGETLWGIAVKFYGNGSKWKTIASANGIKDPKKLKAGMKLRIP